MRLESKRKHTLEVLMRNLPGTAAGAVVDMQSRQLDERIVLGSQALILYAMPSMVYSATRNPMSIVDTNACRGKRIAKEAFATGRDVQSAGEAVGEGHAFAADGARKSTVGEGQKAWYSAVHYT